MAKLWAIARRELQSYFVSPLAYVIAALFALVSGYMFTAFLNMSKEPSMQGLFQNLAVIFLFITPSLTMRLLAEEKARGTLEMLLTSPVTDRDIVFGKYLASLIFLVFLLAITLPYPIILEVLGSPHWPTIATGYLGTFLLGASFLAIGLLASSFTDKQMIAGFVTFALSLVIWLLPAIGGIFGQPWQQGFEYMSIISHQENLGRGVIDTADIIYYLTFIAGAIFLTIRSVELARWR